MGLRRRTEEGHRAREPLSGDPEADAEPGALEAVHHVSDVEAALLSERASISR